MMKDVIVVNALPGAVQLVKSLIEMTETEEMREEMTDLLEMNVDIAGQRNEKGVQGKEKKIEEDL